MVKGQRQNVVMLVHDTPSHDYTPTSNIIDLSEETNKLGNDHLT